MKKIKNLAILGALTVGLLLVASSRADAALQLALQQAGVNGGAVTQVGLTGADFTSTVFTGTYGDFTVTIFGGASNNTATLSSLLSASVSVTNNNAAARTLSLWVTQDNYTLPLGTPLAAEASLGGSVNSGTLSLTNIFAAYGDRNNNLFGTTDQSYGPVNASFTSGTSFATTSATGLFIRTGNYSLTSQTNLALGGNSPNYSSHINLTAVPEPASMLLLGTGLLGLAGVARRRLKGAIQ